ncbi:MAG TPA: hypothetical protein VNX21_08375, partial [Candidatus Thermoplasmatota archaeon]|nr:hypothetical protein [Candidatus Thermoplasmatota archaeon]
MRRPVVLALALLALPLPLAAAQTTYAVDATLELVDAGKAVERHVFTYGGGRQTWRLVIPEGASFVRAYDAVSTLQATPNGDDLSVESRRSPFTVEYARVPFDDAPFTRVSTQVASAPASPTSVRLALPDGWSLVGQRASQGAAVDAQGVLRATGPQSAEFLLLPPGVEDAGPDPRVRGEPALREAVVDVAPAGASMAMTVVYDTDVYSRDWTLTLPDGATLRGVSTPWGEVAAEGATGTVRFTLPYPAGYGLGARPFTLTMDLAAPQPHGGAFRKVQASVPAAAEDVVRVEFRVAEGLVATGVHASEGATVEGLRASGDGPLAATLSFLPPTPAGSVRFEQHPWVVETPAALEAVARATAAAAASMLGEAAGFAGGGNVTRPFYVAYTDAPVFDWEEGFYSPGLNTISIRASELRNVTDGKAHLKPVQVLVHETTHGLLDRLVAGGPADLSFFQEGLARLAETKVEMRMSDEVFDCTRTGGRQSCVRHSSRPDPEKALAFAQSGASIDPAWKASQTPADQRGFLYDVSGMAMHRYERASPAGALEAALADLAAAPGPDDPGLAAVRLVDALLLQSPNLSREALLRPGHEAASLPLEEFRACMGPLVAPGFPFDDPPRMPAAGCPQPAPPTQAERDGLT